MPSKKKPNRGKSTATGNGPLYELRLLVDKKAVWRLEIWLGMAMHRKHPRRVLAALRTLLTIPQK